jgi:two-component system NtrC family response regulator
LLVESGAFRQDLYYRISEVTIRIPPLRDRPGDAIVIAQTVMERRAREHGRPVRGFTPDALKAIQAYPWPGNIRELENRVNSAVIMAEGKHISLGDLQLADVASIGVDWLNLRAVRQRAESDAIRQALAFSHGNLSRAAELLGITRPTLYDLLEKNSISVADRTGEG